MDQTDNPGFLMPQDDVCREATQIVLKARFKIIVKKKTLHDNPSTEGVGFLALLQTNVVSLHMMFGSDGEQWVSREIKEKHAAQW